MKRHARSRKARRTVMDGSTWMGQAFGLGRSQQSQTARYEVAVPVMRREVNRKLLSARLVSALLLIVSAWLVYWFSGDDMFYITSLRVSGSERLSGAELLATSGLEGINIFWVDTQSAVQAIEALPDVASARVHCGIPADCVVELVERSPLFVWRQGDAQVWIGDDGKVLPVRGELTDAITLNASDSRALKPGDQIDLELVTAVEELRQLKLDVSVYDFSNQFGLVFQNEYGWSVRLGDGSGVEMKLKALDTLTKYLVDQNIVPAYVDVRYPDAPYYRE